MQLLGNSDYGNNGSGYPVHNKKNKETPVSKEKEKKETPPRSASLDETVKQETHPEQRKKEDALLRSQLHIQDLTDYVEEELEFNESPKKTVELPQLLEESLSFGPPAEGKGTALLPDYDLKGMELPDKASGEKMRAEDIEVTFTVHKEDTFTEFMIGDYLPIINDRRYSEVERNKEKAIQITESFKRLKKQAQTDSVSSTIQRFEITAGKEGIEKATLTCDVNERNALGKGAFGVVARGTIVSGAKKQEVAVKPLLYDFPEAEKAKLKQRLARAHAYEEFTVFRESSEWTPAFEKERQTLFSAQYPEGNASFEKAVKAKAESSFAAFLTHKKQQTIARLVESHTPPSTPKEQHVATKAASGKKLVPFSLNAKRQNQVSLDPETSKAVLSPMSGRIQFYDEPEIKALIRHMLADRAEEFPKTRYFQGETDELVAIDALDNEDYNRLASAIRDIETEQSSLSIKSTEAKILFEVHFMGELFKKVIAELESQFDACKDKVGYTGNLRQYVSDLQEGTLPPEQEELLDEMMSVSVFTGVSGKVSLAAWLQDYVGNPTYYEFKYFDGDAAGPMTLFGETYTLADVTAILGIKEEKTFGQMSEKEKERFIQSDPVYVQKFQELAEEARQELHRSLDSQAEEKLLSGLTEKYAAEIDRYETLKATEQTPPPQEGILQEWEDALARQSRSRRTEAIETEVSLVTQIHGRYCCPLVTAFETETAAYVVTERASGQIDSLMEAIKKDPNHVEKLKAVGLSLADVTVSYAIRMLFGFAELHELGFVHRDIAEKNILLGPDGEIMISDFGFVHRLEEADSVTIKGTAPYMSKQVHNGAHATAEGLKKADGFATGVTIHFLHFGADKHPYGDMKAFLSDQHAKEIITARKTLPYPKLDPDNPLLTAQDKRSVRYLVNLLCHPDPAKQRTPKEALIEWGACHFKELEGVSSEEIALDDPMLLKVLSYCDAVGKTVAKQFPAVFELK